MPPTIRDRAGHALVTAATTNAVDRWAMQRSLQSQCPESRGYDQARAALQFAEIAERVMLWVGFRLSRPAVPTA